MKKIFSLLLMIFIFLSQFQVGLIYASEQAKLDKTKDLGVKILDKVEKITDKTIDKLDKKIKDPEKDKRLKEKSKEIEEYIKDSQEKIKNESSKKDIKEILKETKKTVVLKVVSGVTDYEDIEANIPKEIASNSKEKKQAMETIKDSIKMDDDYKLIVKTKYSKTKLRKLFDTFDENISIDEMYNQDKYTYFEIGISKDSIFRREMMEDIESGNLPESFMGVNIVLPEVFAIGELDLSGENLSRTWGIKKYEAYKYFEKLENKDKKIKVGVVDTGIDYNHPDLSGKVLKGYDFVNDDSDAWDDQGHGTHVAGTIAANLNSSGIIGVNPYVELVPLKICNHRGYCPSYAVIKALEYAKKEKLDLLNMSLGGRGNPNTNSICDSISSAVKDGIIVVAASGNSNINTSKFVPSGCKESISVAAVDEGLKRASFSNYGEKVDVSAPGVGVYSTYPGNKYRLLNGTSMATPHVVGLISIMKSYKDSLDSKEIKKLFKENEIKVSHESSKYIAGFTDIKSLIESLDKKQEDLVLEEKTGTGNLFEEEKIEDDKQEEIIEEKDDTDMIKAINFMTNQFELDKVKELEDDFELPELEIESYSEKLDFLDSKEQDLEINSEGEIEEKSQEEISVDLVDKKQDISTDEIQYFDENGDKIDGVEINSESEGEEENAYSGKYIEGEISVDEMNKSLAEENEASLQELSSDGEELNIEDEEDYEDVYFEENRQEELFIDGAEKAVEINSIGEEKIEELELKEYSEISKFSTIGDLSFSGEISLEDFEELELKEEKLDSLGHTEELFIDGAEKRVEINSVGEKKFEEIEFLDEEEILNPSGEAKEDIEFESLSEEEKMNIEKLSEIGYSEEEIKIESDAEVFIDGAKASELIEINSSGEEDLEEVETHSSGSFIVDDIIISENPIYTELSDEEINKLEDESKNLDENRKIIISNMDEDDLDIIRESENGLEINSIGEDQEVEKIEIELSPEQIEELENKYKNEDKDDIKEIETSEFEYIEKENNNENSIELEGIIELDNGVEINSVISEGGQEESKEEIELIIESEEDLKKVKDYEIDESEIEKIELPDGYEESVDDDEDDNYQSGYLNTVDESEIIKKEDSSTEEGSMGIQNTYYCTVYEGSYCQYYLRKSRRYKSSHSVSGIAKSYYLNKYYTRFYGEKQGNTTIKYYDNNNREFFTLYITVKKAPEPVLKEAVAEKGKYTKIYIKGLSNFTYSFSDNSILYAYNRGNYLYIRGKEVGNSKIYFRDKGLHVLSLDVKVNPPIIKGKVTEGETFRQLFSRAHSFNYSLSDPSLSSISTGRNTLYINTKKAGTQYIKAVDYTGNTRFILELDIKPLPIIEREVYVGKSYDFSSFISYPRQYNYSFSDTSIAELQSRYRRKPSLYTKKEGILYIKVSRNGKSLYNLKILVKPIPKPKVYDISLKEGAYTNVYIPNGSNFSLQSSNGGKVRFYYSRSSNSYRFRGDTYGSLVYYVYRDGIHFYTLNISVNPKKDPETKKLDDIYEGKNTIAESSYSYSETIFRATYKIVDESGKVDNSTISIRGDYSWRTRLYTLNFTGNKSGSYTVYQMHRGVLINTYKIKVKPLPEPVVYDIKVQKGKSTNIYLPIKDSKNYKFSQKSNNGGYVLISGDPSSKVSINGHSLGNTQIKVYDDNYINFYILNIQVFPEPPKIIEKEIYVTKYGYIKLDLDSRNYYYSFSEKDFVSLYNWGSNLRLKGKKEGKVEIYAKQKGFHMYTIKLKIKAVPEVKEKSVEIFTKDTGVIYLPNEFKGNYEVVVENTSLFKNRSFKVYQNSIGLSVRNIGKAVLHIYEKDTGYNFEVYRINVIGKVREKNIDMNLTDTLVTGFGKRYRLKSSNFKIAYIKNGYNKGGSFRRAIQSNNIGETYINISRSGIPTYIYHIKVKPIPEPKELQCTTLIGNRCVFNINNNGGSYSQTRRGISEVNIDRSKGRIKVEAKSSGVTKIYLYSAIGNYISHILTVNSIANPPETYTCKVPNGSICESYRHYLKSGDEYSFKVSKTGMLKVGLNNYTTESGLNYRKYSLKTLKKGETELYVYNNQDHVATIKVETFDGYDKLNYSTGIVVVKEGRRVNLDIKNGYMDYYLDYQSYEGDKRKAYIYVNRSSGELEINGIKAGNTYAKVKDRYNKYGQVKIKVEDSRLKLEKYELELNPGEEVYLKAIDYYQGLDRLYKSNNNILVYKEIIAGELRFKIKALYSGESIIHAMDKKFVERTIRVKVTGNKQNPDFEGYKYDAGRDNCTIDYSGDPRDGTCGTPPEDEKEKPDSGDAGEEEGEDNKEEDFMKELNELFKDFGIEGVEINSEEGVDVNSVKDAPRCELANTGKYWVRPYNAVCVEDDKYNAWKCKDGYKDISLGNYANTCMKQEIYDAKYEKSRKSLKSVSEKIKKLAEKKDKSKVEVLKKNLSKLQLSINSNTRNKEKLWAYNYIIDEYINELDKKVNKQVKEYQDLRGYFVALQIMSNNGLFLDLYIDDYKGKTDSEIENYARNVSEKLFEYHLEYDKDFKKEYEKQAKEIQEIDSMETLEEIKIGLKQGAIDGTRDYLMGYKEAVGNLMNLDFSTISTGFGKIFSFVKDPLGGIVKNYDEFKKAVESGFEGITGFDGKEYAQGTSYLGTQFALGIADPAKVIGVILGGGVLGKITIKINKYLEKLEKRDKDNKKEKEEEKKCKKDEIYSSQKKKCLDKYEYAAGSSSSYTANKLRILDKTNSWTNGKDANAILNFRYHLKKSGKPILSNPSGMQWHHIVEQHADNIKKFGAKKIHSVENMVLIPGGVTGSLHGKISGYYGSKYRDEISGEKYSYFRDYIKTLSFDEQYEDGIKILKKFGGGSYLNN